MYTILKPESRKYLSQIEYSLESEDFKIKSRHSIKSWTNLARYLYEPQVQESRVFASELDCYLKLTNYFFGDSGAVLLLSKKGNIIKNLEQLYEFKKNLRKKILYELNDSIKVFIDMDKFDPEQRYHIGTRGALGFGNEIFRGRWAYFFFKQIHVPDPNIASLEREMTILKNNGILNEEIPPGIWEQMKQMESLVLPSKRGDIYG